MEHKKFTVVGLGELLWDLFPSGRKLGGAPANFAFHAAQLGDHGLVASRVGSDELGREALDRLKALGISTEYVQVDEERPTGTVDVRLDGSGVPDFTINPGAWDHLDCPDELLDLAERADAVCFGSLAQRAEPSCDAMSGFIGSVEVEAVCVFDINLRQSYYSAEVVTDSLEVCSIAKMNDEELPRVMDELGMTAEGQEGSARALLERFYLDLVCVTRGEKGCLLVSDDETVEHPGFKVDVADTVGSGDAFTAALVHHLLRGTPLAEAAEAANRMGAFVATKGGATPELDDETRRLVTRREGEQGRGKE